MIATSEPGQKKVPVFSFCRMAVIQTWGGEGREQQSRVVASRKRENIREERKICIQGKREETKVSCRFMINSDTLSCNRLNALFTDLTAAVFSPLV